MIERSPLGPALVAGLVAAALYLPSLDNGFAWDDERDIRDNPAVVDASGPLEVVTSPYRGAVPSARSPYRPVTSLSYWLNWAPLGADVRAFHAANVALHTLATMGVAGLLAALGAGASGTLIGALLFAVHPVHVEAVANVVGRADVLMTLFCLLAGLVYLRRDLGDASRAGLVAVLYALALGSKENGVVLPALLPLLLWARTSNPDEESAPLSRAARRRLIRRELGVLAPTALVLGGYLLLRYRVLGTLIHRDTAPYVAALSPSDRVTTAVANVAHLVRLLVWPADLSADYGPDLITVSDATSVRFWVGVFLLLASVAVGVALVVRRERLGALAVGWMALSVLIVSNLVIPIGVWLAERTLYLPSVGIALAAAAIIRGVAAYAPGRVPVVWVAAGVLAAAGAWRSVERIPSWADNESVLATLADEHPESYRSQWWLARGLSEVGDHAAALRWYEQARVTNPYDLGLALDQARALLLADRPGEAEALAESLPPTDPARFVYLAQSKIMTGREDEAVDDVLEGLERFPGDARLRGQAVELGIPLTASSAEDRAR